MGLALTCLVAGPLHAQTKKTSDDDLLNDMGATPAPTQPKPDGAPSKGSKTSPPASPSPAKPVATEAVKASSPVPLPAPAASAPAESAASVDAATLDRIKAVPKKPTLKRGRLELAVFPSLSLNDAYYEHLGVAASAVFYPQDAFGIGIGADYLYDHIQTNNIDVVRRTLTAVPATIDLPKLFAHVDFYWVPIYAKASILADDIAHFEFYLTTGVGVASALNGRFPMAGDGGIGTRVGLFDWLSIRIEVRDTFFVDRLEVNNLSRSSIQNYVMLMAGVSFFVPPSFEYRIR